MNSGFDTFMGQFVVQRRPASRRTPSQYELSKVGFPIRKSSDQSLFAAPQGLSQRTTSFIASQRQGIHRMLLRHLITLMIDVRRPRTSGYHPKIRPADLDQKDHCGSNLSVRALACRTYPIGGAVTPSLVVGTRRPN